MTVLVVSGTAAVADTATGATGPDTHTQITSPSHDITYHFKASPSAVNSLTVSGTASSGVTAVNIACILLTHFNPDVMTLASDVPVTGGAFSTVATFDNIPVTCRLRAVPTDVDPETQYVGSFAGPLVRSYLYSPGKDAGKVVSLQAADMVGSGVAVVADAGDCGVAGMLTVLVPQALLVAPGTGISCAFAMPATNLTDTGTPTAPAIRVDGKNAYLPYSVSDYLRGTDLGDPALTLSQTAITTHFTRHSNGDITVSETGPLDRCNGSNTYPPTSGSCSNLVATGVSFKRVYNIIRGSHQVEISDSFVSTDGHAHNVTAQYQFNVPTPASPGSGSPGYIYPHHSNTFSKASLDKVVTGFGTGPASVFVRSDIYAVNGDDEADTIAYTWSRPPSKIQFSHTSTRELAMPYSFSVPANGSAKIGFAESEAQYTSDAKTLAAKAEADL